SVRAVSHRFPIRTAFDTRRICPPERVPMAVHAEPASAAPRPKRALPVNLTVRTLLVITAFVALGWALIFIREAVLTIFFALFAALVLEPVVTLVQRRFKWGRG